MTEDTSELRLEILRRAAAGEEAPELSFRIADRQAAYLTIGDQVARALIDSGGDGGPWLFFPDEIVGWRRRNGHDEPMSEEERGLLARIVLKRMEAKGLAVRIERSRGDDATEE